MKLPHTKKKPLAVVKYKTDYVDSKVHNIKIYDEYVVMSRKGFEEMLFSNREYSLLDKIYKTAGKLNDDGTSMVMSLYPN